MSAALAASLRLAAPRRWAAAPLRRRCAASASADAPQPPPAVTTEAPLAKRAWRGRSALDFSALPAAAAAPDVLLLDGTYFACSVRPSRDCAAKAHMPLSLGRLLDAAAAGSAGGHHIAPSGRGTRVFCAFPAPGLYMACLRKAHAP
jgi:hypothetical protein